MKKIYTLIAAMAFAGVAFGQHANKAQYPVKDENGVSARPNMDEHSANRAVIWSEDFAAGIPATWSNNTIQGPVDWKYTTVGHTGAYPTAAILSTTASNGWIIVDSDGDNFSGGGQEEAELTTDVINLQGQGTDFRLSFQQMFREWQSDSCIIRVSTDGFATYTEYNINDGIGQSGTPNPDIVSFNITTAVAPNPANVQIRFRWVGSWDYGWQIDDVVIEDIPPHDLRVKTPAIDSDIEYFMAPLNQGIDYDFSANVQNLGLSAENNVILTADVSDGTTTVFTGSSAPINQAVNQTDSLNAGSYTPAAIGMYSVTMTASMDNPDDEPGDNTVSKDFEITECWYARDDNVNGGGLGNGQTSYEYGNAYDIFTGSTATQVSWGVDPRTVPGALMYGVLYNIDPNDGSFVYIDQTPDITIQASDLNNWVTGEFSTPPTLNAGESYVVCVGFYGGLDSAYVMRGSNSAPDQTSFILDGADNTWYFTNRVPAVRLGAGCPVGIEEQMEAGVAVTQNMPNPFAETTTVRYTLTEASNVSVEVIDVTGKTVMTLNEGNRAAGEDYSVEINATGLEAGIYFYSVITDKGRVTRQMVVAK